MTEPTDTEADTNVLMTGYISSGAYSDDVHRNLRFGVIYGNSTSSEKVIDCLDEISSGAGSLDVLKKMLFYGKDHELGEASMSASPKLARIGETLAACGIPVDLFHGIVGYLTEAGELAEALSNALSSRDPIDLVNLKEEIGDGLWYAEVMCRAAETTLEECASVNTAKLRKRYPDNFTEDTAINRDTGAERELMESMLQGDGREETFASGSNTDS